MTDREMIKLCAETMGYEFCPHCLATDPQSYDPLNDDAQAMALVKRLRLMIGYSNGWSAQKHDDKGLQSGSFHYHNLNRAIVECVARLQHAKLPKP